MHYGYESRTSFLRGVTPFAGGRVARAFDEPNTVFEIRAYVDDQQGIDNLWMQALWSDETGDQV
ncbi:MAG TPA: hypothetical protein VE398_13725 [Acidobacteriota bacterium]|nr:hypothetical protein [Acidobacteriota bacterium]